MRVLTRFANTLRADARARGLSPADIDELLQDIRVRLWKTGASDETLDGLGTSCLKRVAISAAVDMRRRRRARQKESIEELDGATEIPQPLQVAAPDHADEELATMTGWTEGKVRNPLFRGLDELRALLSEDGSMP